MKRYANNKRKQSFVAEFFPDVNQITSRTHTLPTPTSPLPFSNPLERLELAYVGGRRGGAYARGHTRQFIRLEWNRIEINSPPRFRRNVWNLLKRGGVRTHVQRSVCRARMCYAYYTHHFLAKMRSRGWSRSKIDSVARIRLQGCQLARCPRRKKVGTPRLCTAAFGRIRAATPQDEKARLWLEDYELEKAGVR